MHVQNIPSDTQRILNSCLFNVEIVCRFQGPPALSVCVAAACGAAVTSAKTRPRLFVYSESADLSKR